MSRVPIAKVLLIISFPLLDRSNRLFGGSSFVLSNLQARHAFNRSIPPASGSFIRLDYEKREKKGKDRSSNYPLRHERSQLFGAPSWLISLNSTRAPSRIIKRR